MVPILLMYGGVAGEPGQHSQYSDYAMGWTAAVVS
jgi:hypothetical protein